MAFTAAQLLERKKHLGASEAGAACGLNDWFTQLQLWNSKVGDADPIDVTIPMMVGNALEPVVLELFERERNTKVIHRQLQCSDPAWPVRRATLDGVTLDGDLVEAKTSGGYLGWGEEDTDQVPVNYILQVHHQFLCYPTAKVAWIPVIIGGRTFRIYRVQRSEDVIKNLDQLEREFWMHVEQNTSPDAADMDDLKFLYPVSTGDQIEASPDIVEAVHSLSKVKADKALIIGQEDELAFQIKSYMKDKAALVSEGKMLATYKGNDVTRLDLKSFRKDHPGMAEAYSNTTHERKLLLKV